MSTPLRTIQDIIRQRRRPLTPGWAGGYPLDDEYSLAPETPGGPEAPVMAGNPTVARSRIAGRVPPAPSAPNLDVPGPRSPGDPATLNELGPPPAPPLELSAGDSTRPRSMFDPRTGEPHKEAFVRGRRPPVEELTSYRNALQQWQPQGRRGLKDILKSAGIGALLGLGSKSENPLLAAAGGALAGGVGQLAKPSYGGRTMRDLKLQREGGNIDQAINEDYRQAMTDRMKVATDEARADLVPDPQNPGRLMRRPQSRTPHYEKDAEGNLLAIHGDSASTVLDKQGKPVKVISTDKGELVEVEVNGRKLRVTPGQALTYYGGLNRPDAQSAQASEGTALAESTQAAFDALKSEVDQHKTQLKENERAIREKNAWLRRRTTELLTTDPELRAAALSSPEAARKAAMERARTEDEDLMQKQGISAGNFDELTANTESLKTAIAEKERRLAGMEQDIRQGRAKGARRGQQAPTPQPYAGRTMSQANLERYARDKNLSLEEARKQVEEMGVRVQ